MTSGSQPKETQQYLLGSTHRALQLGTMKPQLGFHQKKKMLVHSPPKAQLEWGLIGLTDPLQGASNDLSTSSHAGRVKFNADVAYGVIYMPDLVLAKFISGVAYSSVELN